jgi:hypothetical protein
MCIEVKVLRSLLQSAELKHDYVIFVSHSSIRQPPDVIVPIIGSEDLLTAINERN